MKTSRRIKNALGLGLVLTLVSVLGSPASAQTKTQPARKPDTATRKSVDSPPAVCEKCKTEPHEEFSVSKVGEEFVTRTTAVGTKHTCDACGGRITKVRGETRDAMMDYCPVCAKTRRTCCTTEASHHVAKK